MTSLAGLFTGATSIWGAPVKLSNSYGSMYIEGLGPEWSVCSAPAYFYPWSWAVPRNCSRDTDCPFGYYCDNCSELGLYSAAGNMCRPCTSHPDPRGCDCAVNGTAFGLYPVCSPCTGIPGCAVAETCTGPSDQQCPQCEAGTFRSTSAAACARCSNGGADYDCGAGSFRSGQACNGTASVDTQSCTLCRGGSDWDCGAGSIRSPGANACNGTSHVDTQACTFCPAGRSSDSLNKSSCELECEAGYWCGQGSVSPEANECGSVAFYCPQGSTQPLLVGLGYYSIGGSSNTTHTNQSRCEPGYYCQAGVRSVCPEGSYSQDGEASPQCQPCAAGRYGDATTVNTNANCTGPCDAGYACPSRSKRVDPPEARCPAGSWSSAGQASCQSCPAGRFGAGGSTVSLCDGQCTSGYYCPAGTTNATEHKCPAGSFSTQGESSPQCQPCAPGRFGSTGQLNVDKNCSGRCEAGYFCSGGSTSARANECGSAVYYCPPASVEPLLVSLGHYTLGGSSSDTRTTEKVCEPGYACVNGIKTLCEPANGEFSSDGGATFCQAAERGHYASSPENQTRCPIGSFAADPGSSVCSACPSGRVAKAGSAFCDRCDTALGLQPDYELGICIPLEDSPNKLLFSVLGASLLVFGSLYVLHRCKYKQSHPGILGLMGLTLVDFLSDWIFIYSLRSADQKLAGLRSASFFFLVFPLCCNMAICARFLFAQSQYNPSFFHWSKEHQLPAAMATMLGALNVELLTLMQANLFHKAMFSAPLLETDVYKLQAAGMVTNLLEDLPQMIIQGMALSSGSFNVPTVVSLAISGMALLQGIMGRCNSYLLSRITAGPVLESQPPEPQGLEEAASSSSIELRELTMGTGTGDDVLPASSLTLSAPAETSLPTEHWSKLPALRTLLAQEHPIAETDLQPLAVQLKRCVSSAPEASAPTVREGRGRRVK